MTKKVTAYDFRHLRPPSGFHNLNEAFDLKGVSWLHPVESLFGDWNGSTLILGQDYNSWGNILNQPLSKLRHDPNFETNENLITIFGPSCSAVYANYSWFIKDGLNASAPISFSKSVREANAPVLAATIKGMPNIKNLFCLGAKVSKALLGKSAEPLGHKKIEICGAMLDCYALPHPGSLGMLNYQRRRKISKEMAVTEIREFVQQNLGHV